MSVFCKEDFSTEKAFGSWSARCSSCLPDLSHEQESLRPSYRFGVTAEEQRSCRQELHYAGLKILVFHMAEMCLRLSCYLLAL